MEAKDPTTNPLPATTEAPARKRRKKSRFSSAPPAAAGVPATGAPSMALVAQNEDERALANLKARLDVLKKMHQNPKLYVLFVLTEERVSMACCVCVCVCGVGGRHIFHPPSI